MTTLKQCAYYCHSQNCWGFLILCVCAICYVDVEIIIFTGEHAS